MRFQRGVGELSGDMVLSIGLDEDEERRRLVIASWSARTSSSRTSETDIIYESFSRISMNLDDVCVSHMMSECFVCVWEGGIEVLYGLKEQKAKLISDHEG